MLLIGPLALLFASSQISYEALSGPGPADTGSPEVRLDQARVIGVTIDRVENFLGISYAEPPVGDLRFRLPRDIDSYTGTVDATTVGNQCFQQGLQVPPGLPDEVNEVAGAVLAQAGQGANATEGEDCLYVNIARPQNVSADAKLPVMVWIHGGAFSYGSNAIPEYNGSTVVRRSVELDEPIIWVALNYRLNVFGFLGGEEVKKAEVGNLGLQDQRAALRWVNRYIVSFGGDPNKVTIWGESAGAMSVFMHMAANGGRTDGLFRAAIMSSGSAVPTAGDLADIQDTYDGVASDVGCSNASDTLACLRDVSADSLRAAASRIQNGVGYSGVATAYMPRADRVFLKGPPQQLAQEGKVADIPYIIGDVKDEGTLFSLGSFNVTTDDEFAIYVSQEWFPGSTLSDMDTLLGLYPSDPAAGSPFDTGSVNAFTPQYKRIAAMQGDWSFHGPRRLLLNNTSRKNQAYNFLYAREGFPVLGDVHASDLFNALAPGDMTDYFLRFVNHLDPSGKTGVQWPPYNTSSRLTLQFNNSTIPLNVTMDNERLTGTDELTRMSLNFPF